MYTRVAISALADGLVVRPLAGVPQLDTPCLPCPGRMLTGRVAYQPEQSAEISSSADALVEV
jgi:hypothetical protein